MISYTWSKTLDEGGDGYFGVEGGVPEDPYNPRGSRGPASFNIPQMLTANFVYQLPIGVGKAFSTHNQIVNYAIANWQVNGIITARSGQNFNARCATDEAARKRFIEYTHGLLRELLTNYGKIDVLWYDVSWPLDAKGWESERMNKMVFELQPEIIVNNRNHLPGDFSTPEQKIVAETNGRAWESCMTLNDSWGYQRADDNWKSSTTVIRNLITCALDGGNYLLNIGPRPDGSVPEASIDVLTEVGRWMDINGDTIYKSDLCQPRRSSYASFTRTGNTLYMHVHFWPGRHVAISGLRTKVKSARLLKTNQKVNVSQDPYRVHLTELPVDAPDSPVTTIAIECESEPTQDTLFVRNNKPRAGV